MSTTTDKDKPQKLYKMSKMDIKFAPVLRPEWIEVKENEERDEETYVYQMKYIPKRG